MPFWHVTCSVQAWLNTIPFLWRAGGALARWRRLAKQTSEGGACQKSPAFGLGGFQKQDIIWPLSLVRPIEAILRGLQASPELLPTRKHLIFLIIK